MKIQVRFIVAGGIKSPLQCSVVMKYVLWCWNNRGGKNIKRTRHSVTLYVVNCLLF